MVPSLRLGQDTFVTLELVANEQEAAVGMVQLEVVSQALLSVTVNCTISPSAKFPIVAVVAPVCQM